MYQGFYINLDRNVARREALEKNLAQFAASDRYQRIAAVDGQEIARQHPSPLEPGNLGLWFSHAKVLAACQGDRHLHLLEDDAELLGDCDRFERLLRSADAQHGDWDLIFTEIMVTPAHLDVFSLLFQAVERFKATGKSALFDLSQIPFACTSSLFINRRSLPKYSQLVSNGWRQGQPIDIFLRGEILQGRLKAYLTVPFMTTVSPHSLRSDIVLDTSDSRAMSEAVLTAFRRAFAQNADMDTIEAELQTLTSSLPPLTGLKAVYLRTVLFCLSDLWKVY